MKSSLLVSVISKRNRPPPEVLNLFAAGEQGCIWLPNFQQFLFQDAAMTIPAVVGMPVVKQLDLSGRGNTRTLANVTLQQDSAGNKYLAANGTSSTGSTAAIDFSGTSSVNVFMGITKSSDAAAGCPIELSATSSTNAGTFAVFAPLTPANTDLVFRGGSTSAPGQAATKTSLAAPYSAVLTGISNLNAVVELRLNGAVAATAAGNSSGAFGNYPIYTFARNAASLFFNGRDYGTIVRGAACTAGQIADVERYLARLTGVSF